jgi:hypothetical protein
MVLQCLTIGLELAARAWPETMIAGSSLRALAGMMAWAAVAATIWSGAEYLVAARCLVTEPEDGHRHS